MAVVDGIDSRNDMGDALEIIKNFHKPRFIRRSEDISFIFDNDGVGIRKGDFLWVFGAGRKHHDKRCESENTKKEIGKYSSPFGHGRDIARAIDDMRDSAACVIKPSCGAREVVSRNRDSAMGTTASVVMTAESASVETSAVKASS